MTIPRHRQNAEAAGWEEAPRAGLDAKLERCGPPRHGWQVHRNAEDHYAEHISQLDAFPGVS